MTLAPGADRAEDLAEDLADVLATLLEGLRFAELAEALRTMDALRGGDRRRALAYCRSGARLLTLDAVGFGELQALPEDLRDLVASMQFPPDADAAERGALASFRPLAGLMLEAMSVHWERDEMAYVVLLLHLLAEYLPLMAWEPYLGHAGDPRRLSGHVAGTLWATPACPMPQHRKTAAERVLALGAAGQGVPREQWEAYLNRWHARVSGSLRQCARRPGEGRPNAGDAGCGLPCGVVAGLDGRDLGDLAARMTLATTFAESPVVDLRHSAPVGHFFGVPDRAEVTWAWTETVARLTRPWGASGAGGEANPLAAGVTTTDGEPLAGLLHVLSTCAGASVEPTDVLSRLRDEVAVILTPLLEPHVS